MTLGAPWLLLGLAAAAAALWWSLRLERERPALLMPLERRRPEGRRVLLGRWASPVLLGAALALTAAALARPQRTEAGAPDDAGMGIDIMLVLDTSRSMLADDLSPNRLEAAKKTAASFVRGRTSDRIGLVVFGDGPLLACPLTLDREALLERLESVYSPMAGERGTALGDGIASGVNHLKAGKAKSRVLVLLTDGRGNTGVDAVTAAKAAAAMGVKIYAIGAARRGRAYIPYVDPIEGPKRQALDDDLDVETLEQVAALTGGAFWRAETLRQLRDVYAEIDRLERSEVRRPPAAQRVDVYRPFVLAALLLLALETLLSQTVLLRWP